jgi:hypothetical protein
MNGGGKTELRSDPTSPGNFVGHTGNTVRLSIKGPPGVEITEAAYANLPLTISEDRQQFSFQIAPGIAALGVALGGGIVPGVHALVEDHNELARFQAPLLTLTIRGE